LALFIGNMVDVIVATPRNEHQQSVNDFGCCSLDNRRAVLWFLPIIDILAARSTIYLRKLSVIVANFPILIMCINGASTIFRLLTKVIGK
jgi:hypothetical protein